jgi:hypothetical protein
VWNGEEEEEEEEECPNNKAINSPGRAGASGSGLTNVNKFFISFKIKLITPCIWNAREIFNTKLV